MNPGSPGGLDKRKAYILATVVYEYIATAEPVASQTLTQKYHLGVSSATVRNELADLEAAVTSCSRTHRLAAFHPTRATARSSTSSCTPNLCSRPTGAASAMS